MAPFHANPNNEQKRPYFPLKEGTFTNQKFQNHTGMLNAAYTASATLTPWKAKSVA